MEKAGNRAAGQNHGGGGYVPEDGFPAPEPKLRIHAGAGVRYTVPQRLCPDAMRDSVTIRFRVDNVYKNRSVCVYAGERLLRRIPKRILTPGEMEQAVLLKSQLAGVSEEITICTEEA